MQEGIANNFGDEDKAGVEEDNEKEEDIIFRIYLFLYQEAILINVGSIQISFYFYNILHLDHKTALSCN